MLAATFLGIIGILGAFKIGLVIKDVFINYMDKEIKVEFDPKVGNKQATPLTAEEKEMILLIEDDSFSDSDDLPARPLSMDLQPILDKPLILDKYSNANDSFNWNLDDSENYSSAINVVNLNRNHIDYDYDMLKKSIPGRLWNVEKNYCTKYTFWKKTVWLQSSEQANEKLQLNDKFNTSELTENTKSTITFIKKKIYGNVIDIKYETNFSVKNVISTDCRTILNSDVEEGTKKLFNERTIGIQEEKWNDYFSFNGIHVPVFSFIRNCCISLFQMIQFKIWEEAEIIEFLNPLNNNKINSVMSENFRLVKLDQQFEFLLPDHNNLAVPNIDKPVFLWCYIPSKFKVLEEEEISNIYKVDITNNCLLTLTDTPRIFTSLEEVHNVFAKTKYSLNLSDKGLSEFIFSNLTSDQISYLLKNLESFNRQKFLKIKTLIETKEFNQYFTALSKCESEKELFKLFLALKNAVNLEDFF